MSNGFIVKIFRKGAEDVITIDSSTLKIGKHYKNSLPLPVGIESFTLAECGEKSVRLFVRDDIELKLYRAKDSFVDIKDLKGYLDVKDSIEIRNDITVWVSVEGVQFIFKPSALKKRETVKVSSQFKKQFISKENVYFSALFSLITLFLMSLVVIAVFNVKEEVFLIEAPQEKEAVEITYKVAPVEKPAEAKKPEKKQPGTGKGTAGASEEKKQAAKAPAKGSLFEGAAVVSTGILGVQEGAKTVIIKKEKSLFSKLDDTLGTVPVKSATEVSSKPVDRTFTAAKAEDIYSGPEKKDVAVNLESGEKLKTPVTAPKASTQVTVIKGKRPEGEILNVLGRYKKGFEFVFIEERKKDPGLKGKVTMYFVIAGNGAVTHAEVAETDITNREFLNKVVGIMKSIKFPPSEYGETSVKIPLVFFPS